MARMSEKPDLGLEADDLSPDPMTQFRRWFEDAEAEGIHLANAVALATAGADGHPNVRHVLLRRFDEDGFVFYTNYESRKARELSENPWAAFTLLWRELDRQVGVRGSVESTSGEESDAYFATRPREAQIGTWASPQSDVIDDRGMLMARFEAADARFPDVVPRPHNWGGYRIVPATMEFWRARAFRLHDRLEYRRPSPDAPWTTRTLYP